MKKSTTFILINILLTFNFCNLCYSQYTKLLDFSGIAKGKSPQGSLISDGTFLYGVTGIGGTGSCSGGCGTIFKIKTDGTEYFKLLDFAGASNGEYIQSSLISVDTFLYGMTRGGGTNDMGTIFRIKPDGTAYAKLLDFSGTSNGADPYGEFIFEAPFLYGMTGHGGINGVGTIFKIKTDGSAYSKLLDFSDTTNGNGPYGSLFSDGIFLYGMTNSGGVNGIGTVFKIKTDGTGYFKLLDFNGAVNGEHPWGSLISDNTFLYGMTSTGGTETSCEFFGCGVLFKIKPDGTGYSKLLDFAGTANGGYPMGALFSDGNFLYGMARYGGINNFGVLFKIKPDGTEYVKLFDFDGVSNGKYPQGSLISDGSFLYGMTSQGGAYDDGVLFKYSLVSGISESYGTIKFNVYPNPGNGTFVIRMKDIQSSMENYQLSIYNLLGEIVYQSEVKNQNTEIDLNEEPEGIYFIKIKTEKGCAVQKLVINK